MTQLLKPVCRFLDGESWTYEDVEGRDAIRCGIQGDSASYMLIFDAVVAIDYLAVYVLAQIAVPVDRRQEAALFLTRANYGLRLGNFELDLDDGEVRYKVGIALGDGVLTPGMVGEMVAASVTTMDRYFSGLMSVSFGTASAYDACRIVEADMRDAQA